MTQTSAMLCALAGYFFWVLSDTTVRVGALAAMTPSLILAVSAFSGAACIALLAYFRGNVSLLRPQCWRKQTGIAVYSVVINFANVVALKHLPLTMFYIVAFTSPFIVAALSAALKHETLSPIKIACLVTGFSGVALAIDVQNGGGDWIGYLGAFVSVFFFSYKAVLMRKMGKEASAESTQFFVALSVGTAGVLGVLLQPAPLPEAWTLAVVAFSGIIGVLGGVLYIRAIQNTVTTNVAQLHYTQIVWGAILGYLIWHEVPTWNLVAGSIVIIVSGMVVAAQARKNGETLLPNDTGRKEGK